jgi:hypothetical protein
MTDPIPSRIRQALTGLRDLLNGAPGIKSTLDPGTVQVPGAWIQLGTIPDDAYTLGGLSSIVANVYLVAPDSGAIASLDHLGNLLDQLLTVVEPDGPITSVPLVTPASNPAALPALMVPVSLDL